MWNVFIDLNLKQRKSQLLNKTRSKKKVVFEDPIIEQSIIEEPIIEETKEQLPKTFEINIIIFCLN